MLSCSLAWVDVTGEPEGLRIASCCPEHMYHQWRSMKSRKSKLKTILGFKMTASWSIIKHHYCLIQYPSLKKYNSSLNSEQLLNPLWHIWWAKGTTNKATSQVRNGSTKMVRKLYQVTEGRGVCLWQNQGSSSQGFDRISPHPLRMAAITAP